MRRLLTLTVALLASACADPSSPGGPPAAITELPRALTPAEQEVIQSTSSFAFGLFREVNHDWAAKNVFISPLSASMALGMTMNGTATQTFDEMRQMLGFGSRPLPEINAAYQSLIELLRGLDPRVTFQLANAIWYDRPFEAHINQSFLDDVQGAFGAEVGPLDMGTPASVETVNTRAKDNTNGKIEKVLDSTSDLVALLANAIYFKGDWREQFKAADTRPESFNRADGTVAQAPTMYRSGKARAALRDGVQWLELPYGGDAFAMSIAMPAAGTNIDTFAGALTSQTWEQGLSSMVDYDGEMYLPKFRLAWEDTLQSPLKRLGMTSAFASGVADFTRLSTSRGRDLFVSFVKQNTFVDVNEEGTEAAAVTTVGIVETSAPAAIRIDHPFVFAIRERLSGTILFMGKIVSP